MMLKARIDGVSGVLAGLKIQRSLFNSRSIHKIFSQVAQIFGETNRLERYAEVIVVIGSSPVLTTFHGVISSVG